MGGSSIGSGSSSQAVAVCEQECFYTLLMKGREQMEVSHGPDTPWRGDLAHITCMRINPIKIRNDNLILKQLSLEIFDKALC